jgi:hypothetical protein
MHASSLADELITQPARKLFGRIGSERTSAVQGALPAVRWEIFPMFGKPTIDNKQQRWDNVALSFAPAIANPLDASRNPQSWKPLLVRTPGWVQIREAQRPIPAKW